MPANKFATASELPEGFLYRPNFLNQSEEAELRVQSRCERSRKSGMFKQRNSAPLPLKYSSRYPGRLYGRAFGRTTSGLCAA